MIIITKDSVLKLTNPSQSFFGKLFNTQHEDEAYLIDIVKEFLTINDYILDVELCKSKIIPIDENYEYGKRAYSINVYNEAALEFIRVNSHNKFWNKILEFSETYNKQSKEPIQCIYENEVIVNKFDWFKDELELGNTPIFKEAFNSIANKHDKYGINTKLLRHIGNDLPKNVIDYILGISQFSSDLYISQFTKNKTTLYMLLLDCNEGYKIISSFIC